jgi:predicted amidohydrolase YtcJ
MDTSQAQLVLINGVIDTLTPETPRTSALAVRDGKVAALGAEARSLQGPDTEVVDLAGAYAMPGLLDVHNHHLLAGQMDLFEINAVSTLTLDALLEAVADHASNLGPDEWVIGGSWGAGLLNQLKSVESLRLLDDATGGRPALLKDDSKHNRWANSAAMALAGIDDATPDPEGGQILRDAEGRATGVLIEAAGAHLEKIRERLHPTSVEDVSRAVRRGIEILHSYGITAFQDAAASLQLMQSLRHLDEQGELRAWVVTSMLANDFIFGTEPLGEGIIAGRDATRSEHHRPDFIKIFLDGVPPSGTAAFIEPYLEGVGFPECHHGQTTMDAAELEGWLMRTAERGISAKVHCTGDAAVRLVLDTVEKVRAAGHHGPRYHVAHGQFVHPEDIARFAELDVVADISPALWFPGVIPAADQSVLGEERGSRLQPNRSLLDAGATVAGGSDWPVSVSPNVWEGVYGLITRQDPTGQFPGTLWPEEAITLDEAIRVYTTAAAEAMGLADVAGTLAPGKSADFVVLSDNPYEVLIDEIPSITARQTWFAGTRVFSAAAKASSAAKHV